MTTFPSLVLYPSSIPPHVRPAESVLLFTNREGSLLNDREDSKAPLGVRASAAVRVEGRGASHVAVKCAGLPVRVGATVLATAEP